MREQEKTKFSFNKNGKNKIKVLKNSLKAFYKGWKLRKILNS